MTDSLFKADGGDKLTRIETFPIEFTIDTTNDANQNQVSKAEQTTSEFVSITTTTENATQNIVVST